jgi:hypothetical protein
MGQNFDNDGINAIVTHFFEENGLHVERHKEKMNGPGKESCHVALRSGQELPDFEPLRTKLQEAGYTITLGKSLITEADEKEHFAELGYDPDLTINFDVTHPKAGKDATAEKFAASADYSLAAGDGGNDDLLLTSPHIMQAIVTGNAANDLLSTMREQADQSRIFYSTLPAGLVFVEHEMLRGRLSLPEIPSDIFGALPPRIQGILQIQSDLIAKQLNAETARYSA